MPGEELADGIHRIQHLLDGKIHAYHIVETETGLVAFDTGVPSTPTDHFEPYLEDLGYSLSDIREIIVTHADADHFGGNGMVREANPDVVIAAHEADIPLIESSDAIMRRRYRQFERYGVEFPEESLEWLRDSLPDPDQPIDLGFTGGECVYLEGGRSLEIFHTPGHTAGHILAYDRHADLVIGGDAVYPEGAFDIEGNVLQPPPYEDADEYEYTIALLRSLSPSTLSLTHFDPFTGDEVGDLLTRASDWTNRFEATLISILEDGSDPMTVPEIIDEVVDRQGSYGADVQIAYPITAHMNRLLKQDRATEHQREDVLPAYELA